MWLPLLRVQLDRPQASQAYFVTVRCASLWSVTSCYFSELLISFVRTDGECGVVLEGIKASQKELVFSKLWLLIKNWFPKFETFCVITGWLSNLIGHLESNRQKQLFREVFCCSSYAWKVRVFRASLQTILDQRQDTSEQWTTDLIIVIELERSPPKCWGYWQEVQFRALVNLWDRVSLKYARCCNGIFHLERMVLSISDPITERRRISSHIEKKISRLLQNFFFFFNCPPWTFWVRMIKTVVSSLELNTQ